MLLSVVLHKQAINVQYVRELKESKLKYLSRLNGADIARSGILKVQFHFTRFADDIDYAWEEAADTTW